MDQDSRTIAAQIHKLAIDLSDAGVAMGDPSQMRQTSAEVERIAQQLSTLSRELKYVSSRSRNMPMSDGALAFK